MDGETYYVSGIDLESGTPDADVLNLLSLKALHNLPR